MTPSGDRCRREIGIGLYMGSGLLLWETLRITPNKFRGSTRRRTRNRDVARVCSRSRADGKRILTRDGSGRGEGAVQRLGEVGDQVVGVLDADREADQVVLDADLEALLAGELVEAHDRGLLDQALHRS